MGGPTTSTRSWSTYGVVVAERCGVALRAEVRLLGFGDGKEGPVDGSGDRPGVEQAGGAP